MEGEHSDKEISKYKRKISKLLETINEMENNFRIKQLNYLFCIGEYDKKVVDLEKKLNINSINKMPKDELKKMICYPHYVKFEPADEINPKSIPMFLRNTKRKKNSTLFNLKKNNKKLSKSYIDSNSFEFPSKRSKENINNSCFVFSEQIENNNNNNAKKSINNEEDKILDKKKEKQTNNEEIKNLIELGKEKFDIESQKLDIFFGKNKNFFLSHPKLNYMNESQFSSWKKGIKQDSFPKLLKQFKLQMRSQKNGSVIFPSFLNEIMVNIEKYRNNQNYDKKNEE